ncbi:uncharacterized protein LOC143059645 [Mytilus galloprovincialis]|uniref:uncharacterized protein LOC143059645 n=1 Tax=Mytilus galloprovincialis TaxID=29158 RepID=UPI003F7BBFDA
MKSKLAIRTFVFIFQKALYRICFISIYFLAFDTDQVSGQFGNENPPPTFGDNRRIIPIPIARPVRSPMEYYNEFASQMSPEMPMVASQMSLGMPMVASQMSPGMPMVASQMSQGMPMVASQMSPGMPMVASQMSQGMPMGASQMSTVMSLMMTLMTVQMILMIVMMIQEINSS